MKSLEENNKPKKGGSNQMMLDEKLRQIHTEELGLGLPEDYFSKSKSAILANVSAENTGKVVPLFRNKIFWVAAATISLLIALTVFKTNSLRQIDELPSIVLDTIEQLNEGLVGNDIDQHESDILISSLFIDDAEIDDFVDRYMIEESLTKEPDLN